MKETGISRLFILTCIAILLASYGVGLGIKKIRFAGVDTKASAVTKTVKPVDKSKSDEKQVAAKPDAPAEASKETATEPDENVAAQPEQSEGGRRTRGGGMSQRFQNMSDEERAQMRQRSGGRSRSRGGSAFSQMSEEDRQNFRSEMDALNAKAGEMSDEEMQQARNEILQKYGITPGSRRSGRGGGGGRRGN